MADTLVDTKWLDSQIKDGHAGNLRIFDTTITINGLGEEDFKRKHIKGAQFLNLFKHTTPTKEKPVNLPDPAEFQEYLRSLGVNSSTHVIIYENTDLHPFAGPRAWWLLRAYGITNVSILNGGLKVWETDGYPVTTDIIQYEKGDVKVKVDKNLIMSYDDVITSSDMQYVDTRPSENFSGETEEPSEFLQAFMPALGMKKEGLHLQAGHVPGAANVPYSSIYDQKNNVTFRPKEELKQLFDNQGVKLTGKVTATCYVGLTACIFAVAASICGFNDVRVYPGSWVEYGQRAPQARVART